MFSKTSFWIKFLLILITVNLFVIWKSEKVADLPQTETFALKVISLEELKAYDGSSPSGQIYIGMDGLVYDVTDGRKYYQKGGVYHYLAGKDSTTELKIAGGGIIKKKYKVVGKLPL